jgi:hypothetical protein
MAKIKQIEKEIKARVLSKITVNDITYEPNQLVEVDQITLKSLEGKVDPHPDAVAYCEGNK